jgi:omega-6 fatty acid desaturase (delta-12 desaturase)
MLQGKQLILATRPFTKEDRTKSWVLTISTLFILIAFLFGTVYNFHWILKLLCSIGAGFTIVRFFVIYPPSSLPSLVFMY